VSIKSLLHILIISAFSILLGCNFNKRSESASDISLLYKDSIYIDFDFDKVSRHYSSKIANEDSISIKEEEDYKKLAEATDRFWKTVEYKNGRLISDISSANDIKLSKRVFKGFIKQLSEGNQFIKKNMKDVDSINVSLVKPSFH